MRVLWLSSNPSLYKRNNAPNGYNGEGWISSLQSVVEKTYPEINLGIAFLLPKKENKIQEGQVTYYPILQKKKSIIEKQIYYWGGYKYKTDDYLVEMLEVIKDFKPDLIHLFGLESPFVYILEHTNTPVIVHIQGILNLCRNAFYPQGMNRFTFLFKHLSVNEWFIHNGYNFAMDNMSCRSKQEIISFQNTWYFMGRTEWDFQISRLLSPRSKYFHVNEILRDVFYTEKPWLCPQNDTFIITSTISQTIYKGLDTILKTAQLLTKYSTLKFEWRVVGVNENSKYVRFFEKNERIKSGEVNVNYMGVLNAVQICENMQQSNVYVHPSYIDNSPNALCEAQLVGIPVIATYVGGIPSLVAHKENGLLVPANAPHETAYWLQYLYNNPDVMLQLGKKARETAMVRHSKEKIVDDVIQVYEKLIPLMA